MSATRLRFFFALTVAIAGAWACGSSDGRTNFDPEPQGPGEEPFVSTSADATVEAEAGFQACVGTAVEAKRERLPVDIIWVVDNSASMQPAIVEVQQGLNAFATLVGSKGLDYKVIMLSLQGTSPVGSGSMRYPVCIPPPLGGADCGNATRFFHAPLDVQSTQPLEQILGTLDQTTGYTGPPRGSIAWSQELRDGASKSIVLVTDDNSRFPSVSFETFPGGENPNTGGYVLPPGILHPSRKGAWKGYVFNAIYGWGDADPSIRCTYPGGGKPAASGAEYTELVAKTKGARAKICEGSAAWGPFFDAVATAVYANARVACELPIPVAEAGPVDPEKVNVRVDDGTNPASTVARVASAEACGGAAGWYYDSPTAPTAVRLCPATCDAVQSAGAAKPPRVDVVFGCSSVVR